MNANKIINIIAEANMNAEVKVIGAWREKSFSFNEATAITGVRICKDYILLDEQDGEDNYTAANMMALLNCFKGLDVRFKVDPFTDAPVSVDSIYITGETVYLCADKQQECKNEAN